MVAQVKVLLPLNECIKVVPVFRAPLESSWSVHIRQMQGEFQSDKCSDMSEDPGREASLWGRHFRRGREEEACDEDTRVRWSCLASGFWMICEASEVDVGTTHRSPGWRGEWASLSVESGTQVCKQHLTRIREPHLHQKWPETGEPLDRAWEGYVPGLKD